MKDRKARRIDIRAKVNQNSKEGNKGQNCLALPDGVERWTPPEKGTYTFDVIPYEISSDFHPDGVGEKGAYWESRPFWTHFIGRNVVCLKSVGKRCPICEEIDRLSKDYKENEDQIRAIKRKEQRLYNIILTDDKKQTIKVFDYSTFKFAEVLEKEIREGEERQAGYANFPDGLTLRVRFSEETFKAGTKPFLKASKIEFLDRENEYDESVLDKAVCLDTVLKVQSYDVLKKMLTDLEDGETEGSAPAPTVRAKKVSVEEENENENENENEENDPGFDDVHETETATKVDADPSDTIDPDMMDKDEILAYLEDHEEDFDSIKSKKELSKMDEEDLQEYLGDLLSPVSNNTSGNSESSSNIDPDMMDKDEILAYLEDHEDELEVDKSVKALNKMDEEDLQEYLKGLLKPEENTVVISEELINEMPIKEIVDFLLNNKEELGVTKKPTELRRMSIKDIRKYTVDLVAGVKKEEED